MRPLLFSLLLVTSITACGSGGGSSANRRQFIPFQRQVLKTIVTDGFVQWARANPTKYCPHALDEVSSYLSPRSDRDVWGRPLIMFCNNLPQAAISAGFGVMSVGPDGVAFTADDLHSWD